MCNKLTLGLAVFCLLLCCLATFPRQAWAFRTGISSCSAMTICNQRPVIAFSNWGAGPIGNENELIIATAVNGAPLSQEDWRFHVLRGGLQVFPNDEAYEGQVALFQVGAGVGLVSTHSVISTDGQSQLFAAWSPGFPQASADWIVSPTGIEDGMWGIVAGAGTEEYIAAAVIPGGYSGQAGAQGIPGIYLAVAQLPLTGSYTDWNTACVQIDKVAGLNGAQRQVKVFGHPTYLSLAACKAGLFLSCYAGISSYNALGYRNDEQALIIGECKAPAADPARWNFIAVDAAQGLGCAASLATDGVHLYVAYNQGIDELWVADCAIADAMNPSAWRLSRVAKKGPFPALGLVGGRPAIACWDLDKPASGLAIKYLFASLGQSGLEWRSCPVPQLEEYLNVGEIAGRPVLSSYSFSGSLDYAWTDKPVPRTEAEWRVATVCAGRPRDNYGATQAMGDESVLPVADTEVFPPIPVPGPMEKLAAGAVRIPRFKLTWLLALLAALALGALAVLVWFVLRWRKRRSRGTG